MKNKRGCLVVFLLAIAFLQPLSAEITAADTALDEQAVKAIFDSIPQYGYAEITAIRDSSEYPADLVFDKGLHDETPRDSVVAIKHLATGKYLAARDADVAGKKIKVLRPDADDRSDKAAQFSVNRHLSVVPKLRDYWGIDSSLANDFNLEARDDGVVGFLSLAFNDEVTDKASHWTLQGENLNEVYLENRPSDGNPGGILTYKNEDRIIKTGEKVDIFTESATWGLVKPKLADADNVIRYGDIIAIGTRKGDYIMRKDKDNVTRTAKHNNEQAAENVSWRLDGGTVGAPVSRGSKVRLVSMGNGYTEVYTMGFNNDLSAGGPLTYDTFGVTFRLDKNDKWLQAYKSDHDGADWGKWHGDALMTIYRYAKKYQYPSDVGSDVVRRQTDGSWRPVGDKKFVKLAVKSDNEVWALDTKGATWEWDGKDWRLLPEAVSFIDIGVNAQKILFGIDQLGKLFLRTDIGWAEKKAVARRVALRTEDWKMVKPSAEVYGTDSMTLPLPAEGDYVVSFKAIAAAAIRVKIASYDIALWDGPGGHYSGIAGLPQQISKFSADTNRTVAIDVGIVVRSSTKEILVYVNGSLMMAMPVANLSLTPNVAQFGASTAPVQYGSLSVISCPPPVMLNAFMKSRNDPGAIAIAAKDAIWCIADDGSLVKYDGGENTMPQPLLGKNVTDVTCADDGTTWAVRDNKQLWQLNDTNNIWELRDPPAEKPFIVDIAVRNAGELYVLGADGSVFLWNGKTWAKQADMPSLSKISVGSGVTKIVTPIMGTVHFDQMMTHDKDDNPCKVSPDGKLAVEVIKLGFGGNIAPQQTVCCTLPALQNPEVSGFARTAVNLDEGATLTVKPLDGRGGAWPKKTFEKPNRATITFLANPSPKGDIQVLLGDSISTSYLFKIKIGTAENTRACIIRRTLVDNKEVDEEVFAIDKQQNALAYASPGNFTPYWITYDNGLILVGMGQPGDHVFMAYRCDDPPDLVDHAGFATKSGQVEYAQIQFLPPVVTDEISRVYKTLPATVSLSANGAARTAPGDDALARVNLSSPGTINWQDIPFRMVGGGMVGFELIGTEQCFVALGEAADASKPHYLVTFGEGSNEGISIKRFTEKGYKLLVMQTNKGFKGLNLDPAKPVKVWVSYDKGLFIIGHGELGQNPVLVYHDFVYLENVSQVGFGASGSSDGSVSNVAIAAPVNLELEDPASLYVQTSSYVPSVSGPLDIILPFWYRIRQEEEKLVLYDRITNQSWFVAGMPQQGTLYSFLATIQEDGFLSMATAKEPDSPIQMAIKRDVIAMQANADLERQKANIVAQIGQLDAARVASAASVLRVKAEGKGKEAETTSAAANGLAGGLAMGAAGTNAIFFTTAIATGVAGSEIAKSLNASATSMMVDAAKIDEEAGRVADAARREAINNQEKALRLEQKANLLAGNAKFAFKGVNAYVYTDDAKRPELGEASLSPEVIGARNYVTEEMNSVGQVPPNSPEAYDSIIGGLQDIVYRTTNCFIVTDIVRKKFIDKVDDLIQAYPEVYGETINVRIVNKVINLLMTAINNSYLIHPVQDAQTRDTFYTWMNKQAQGLIEAQLAIDLKACYGEYIWLPVPLDDSPDNFTLSFEATGQNDLFVAFVSEPARIRNSSTEIYEVKINNDKSSVCIESLGQAVTLLTKEQYKDGAIISPYKAQKYTISLKDGVVSLQVGSAAPVTWTDRYPKKGMRWIGISNWDKPVSFSKLRIQPGTSIAAAAQAAVKAVEAIEVIDAADVVPVEEDYQEPPVAVEQKKASKAAKPAKKQQPKAAKKAGAPKASKKVTRV